MEKHWKMTEEEFEAVRDAIKSVFSYRGQFIEANDGDGQGTSMSFQTFFSSLAQEFGLDEISSEKVKLKIHNHKGNTNSTSCPSCIK